MLKNQRCDYTTDSLIHLTFRYIYGLNTHKAMTDFQ